MTSVPTGAIIGGVLAGIFIITVGVCFVIYRITHGERTINHESDENVHAAAPNEG